METQDVWYMDDSNLFLEVCRNTKAEADKQEPVLGECRACDEAKFEVTFEGLWSRNTHPKVCEYVSMTSENYNATHLYKVCMYMLLFGFIVVHSLFCLPTGFPQ